MKVIYIFNPDSEKMNDRRELELVQKADRMYSSLKAIQVFIMHSNNNWVDEGTKEAFETILDYVEESGIDEIE